MYHTHRDGVRPFFINEYSVFFCSNLAWTKVISTLCSSAWPRCVCELFTVCWGKPVYISLAGIICFHINIGRNKPCFLPCNVDQTSFKGSEHKQHWGGSGTVANVGEWTWTAMRFFGFHNMQFFVYKTFSFFLRTLDLKVLSHEIDLKNVDNNLQNLAYLRDAAGFWIFGGLQWF